MKRPWLLPLVPLYAAGALLRPLLERQRRLRWPVISVGNLSLGGTGKTPFTIALARLLVRKGMPVDVLSRGYGRRDERVERVDTNGTAERFGDEPLLIANEAGVPVYVGAERWLAGELAERDFGGSGVHLLDDGFQHRRLARQVDIVLVNSSDLADTLLPAGDLREGLAALRRAQVLAVADEDEAAVERLLKLELGPNASQEIWRYRRKMIVPPIPETGAAKVVAFCGIARPEQFLEGLRLKGLEVAASVIFPDHHAYTARDLERLRGLMKSSGAGALVTTAKDKCRLGGSADSILAVGLDIVLEEEEAIWGWLGSALGLAAV